MPQADPRRGPVIARDQIMKVGVLGLWHLGSVTAACLAAAGFATLAVDGDRDVIAGLNRGEPPLSEPLLRDLINEAVAKGRLSFTSDVSALSAVDVVWVCYDTPVDELDRADVGAVTEKIEATFPYLADGAIVLISAQLPVGTVAGLERAFADVAAGRTVDFACSPENLRLGRAIEVFRNPGRIVVGVRRDRTRTALGKLLGTFCEHLIWTSVESAEMAKHAVNAFLASSITLTNELALICEQVGADVADVEAALRSDPRIGPQAYVRAGPAFAGGTLARDIRFLSGLAWEHGLRTPLIQSVIPSNEAHRAWILDRLHERLGSLAGQRVAVLGLAYKAGTDAIRRSVAIEILYALVAEHADVRAYDPAVRTLPPELGRGITMAADAASAMQGAAAVVIATEWAEFRALGAKDFVTVMEGNLIIDPGRFLPATIADDPRLKLISVGRSA